MKASIAAGLVFPAIVGGASAAWGFAQERVDRPCEPVDELGCAPLVWHDRTCVVAEIYTQDFDQMSYDEVARALAAAAHTWSPGAVQCPTNDQPRHPYLEIVPSMAAAGATARWGQDGHNKVIFRTSGWLDEPDRLEPTALASTTLMNKKDGRILEVDIEINADLFDWANLDPGSTALEAFPAAHDLQNALTHEFGHFIGLAHVCNAGRDDNTVDDQGNLVPLCNDALPLALREVTMFAVEQGRTDWRSLSEDDVAGICAIYPPEQNPHTCALDLPDDGCGCAADPSPGSPAGLALATLALLKRARTRAASPGQVSA